MLFVRRIEFLDIKVHTDVRVLCFHLVVSFLFFLSLFLSLLFSSLSCVSLPLSLLRNVRFSEPHCFLELFLSHRTFWRCGDRLVPKTCLTLCDPTDCSPPGSPVHGILQAKILEWVIMSFSRGFYLPRGWTRISHISWIDEYVLYY